MQDTVKQDPSLGLDPQVLMDAIAQGGEERRSRLASQIAAFLCNGGEPEAERQQVVPVALRLAADPAPAVRAALASGLSGLEGLHPDLLFAIISDDDEIALPFLNVTPALTPMHMMSVLRVGDDLRQAAVVLRPDITHEIIDFVVRSLPFRLNVLLFENDRATLTPQQFQTLYDRFGDQQAAVDLLLARPDLPASIRILQARRAAMKLQAFLAGRDWIPANDAADIITEAEETTVLAVLAGASASQLTSLVSFLVNQDILTPSIIVRAACCGEVAILANCLAILAGYPVERVSHQIFGGTGLRSLVERAGLPRSCHWLVQAACDVARDERLDGLRLTGEEFGSRMVEALMTRYANMPKSEQPRSLEVVSRYAAGRARLIAQQLKDDLLVDAA